MPPRAGWKVPGSPRSERWDTARRGVPAPPHPQSPTPWERSVLQEGSGAERARAGLAPLRAGPGRGGVEESGRAGTQQLHRQGPDKRVNTHGRARISAEDKLRESATLRFDFGKCAAWHAADPSFTPGFPRPARSDPRPRAWHKHSSLLGLPGDLTSISPVTKRRIPRPSAE